MCWLELNLPCETKIFAFGLHLDWLLGRPGIYHGLAVFWGELPFILTGLHWYSTTANLSTTLSMFRHIACSLCIHCNYAQIVKSIVGQSIAQIALDQLYCAEWSLTSSWSSRQCARYNQQVTHFSLTAAALSLFINMSVGSKDHVRFKFFVQILKTDPCSRFHWLPYWCKDPLLCE